MCLYRLRGSSTGAKDRTMQRGLRRKDDQAHCLSKVHRPRLFMTTLKLVVKGRREMVERSCDPNANTFFVGLACKRQSGCFRFTANPLNAKKIADFVALI